MRIYIIAGSILANAYATTAQKEFSKAGVQAELLHPHVSHADEIPWEATWFYKHGDRKNRVEVMTQLAHTSEQEAIYNTGMTFMNALKKAENELELEFAIVDGLQLDGRLQEKWNDLTGAVKSGTAEVTVLRLDNESIPALAFKKKAVGQLIEKLEQSSYNIRTL